MRTYSQNIEIQTDGTLRPRRGYKSFRGMVWQLWLINRRYQKMGVSGSFVVTLPLKVHGNDPVHSEYRTFMRKLR